jgi:hypothetical protein
MSSPHHKCNLSKLENKKKDFNNVISLQRPTSPPSETLSPNNSVFNITGY